MSSIVRNNVFNGKKYWSPYGSVAPPDGIPDISRYGSDLTFAAGAAAPNWHQLPSGYWVVEYDGGDYASLNVARWRDYDVEGTIAAWVQSSSVANDQTIFATSDTGTDINFLQLRLVNTTGFLEIVQRDGGALNQVTGDVSCTDGRFHFCVVTGNMTLGAWILYVDGVVQGLTVTSGANTGNWFSAIFDIRDNISTGAMLNTGIADYAICQAAPPRVWNYQMTLDQINAIYASERYLFGV